MRERWSGQIGLEHFYEMLEERFLSSSKESSTVLRTLKDYGLIDYASGNVSITDLGAAFLGFLDEQTVALKRAAAAKLKEIRAKNEAAEE